MLGLFGKSWERATATVVAGRYEVSTADTTAGMPYSSELVLEVHPANGAPFRAETTIHHLGLSLEQRRMTPPQEGETVQVEFDPKSHKVKVLLDETHDRRERTLDSKDRLADALNAPVGTAPAGPSQSVSVHNVVLDQNGTTISGDVPAGLDINAILAQAGLDPGNAGQVTVQNVDVPVQAPPRSVSAADILATGTPGTATVQSAELVDQTGAPAGSTMLGISLSVSVPGRAPYPVANVYRTPAAKVPAVSLGAVLPVKVSPADPTLVAVDWDAVG